MDRDGVMRKHYTSLLSLKSRSTNVPLPHPNYYFSPNLLLVKDRRTFIKQVSALGAGLWAWPLIDQAYAAEAADFMKDVQLTPPSELATNEDFWSWVRHNYTASSNLINLNNGGVSPHPTVVQDAVDAIHRAEQRGPFVLHVAGI